MTDTSTLRASLADRLLHHPDAPLYLLVWTGVGSTLALTGALEDAITAGEAVGVVMLLLGAGWLSLLS